MNRMSGRFIGLLCFSYLGCSNVSLSTDEKHFVQLVADCEPSAIRQILGKNLVCDARRIDSTDWVDLTKHKELLVGSITPAARTTRSTDNYAISELQIEFVDGRLFPLTIYHFGKSRVLFSQPNLPSCYARNQAHNPLGHPDKYLDESLAVADLIRAIAQNNEVSEKRTVQMLRQSIGLSP